MDASFSSSGTSRYVVFQRSVLTPLHAHLDLFVQKKGCEYKFYTEFQSHEPEFDYLKSLEIEEKINKIKWCKRQNAAHFLLSTNGARYVVLPPPSHVFTLMAQTKRSSSGRSSRNRCALSPNPTPTMAS